MTLAYTNFLARHPVAVHWFCVSFLSFSGAVVAIQLWRGVMAAVGYGG